MKKIKKFLASPVTTLVFLIIAIALIGFSTIGGARAALTYYSETYKSELSMKDIGVTLVENGVAIASRDYEKDKADGTWREQTGVLLGNMLDAKQNERVTLGKQYPEKLCVKNSGTIDSYVRVTIYKYWLDEKGEKTRLLKPDAIHLQLANLTSEENGDKCWIEDKSAATEERTVLYYNRLLPSMASTPDFARYLDVDVDLEAYGKTEETDNNVITTISEVDGYQFVVEIKVDAVQDHNAKQAILSAWGKNVNVVEQTVTLCE